MSSIKKKNPLSPPGFNKHFLKEKKKSTQQLRTEPHLITFSENGFTSFSPLLNTDVYPTSLLLHLELLLSKQGDPGGQMSSLLRGPLLGNLFPHPAPTHAPAFSEHPLLLPTTQSERSKISASHAMVPLAIGSPREPTKV